MLGRRNSSMTCYERYLDEYAKLCETAPPAPDYVTDIYQYQEWLLEEASRLSYELEEN
jgi:hypothetical protein